jgi:CDP-diacylglycerol--serine O-phosphatidyltransferase
MVSNVKFYSFKEFHFLQTARFRALLLFLALFVLLFYYPEEIIYGFFVVYTVVSYIFWILRIGYKKAPLVEDHDQISESS